MQYEKKILLIFNNPVFSRCNLKLTNKYNLKTFIIKNLQT